MSTPSARTTPRPHPRPDLSNEAQLADLKTLVEIETPTGNLLQAIACAKQIEKIAIRLFGDRIRVLSVSTDYGPIVALQIGRGEPRLALVGHYDSVQPMGTINKQKFKVSGEENNETIEGPATYDMKAGIIAALYGLAIACEENPVKNPGTPEEEDPLDGIIFCATPEEEVASPRARPFWRRLKSRGLTAAIVYEGSIGGAFKTSRWGALWPLVNVRRALSDQERVRAPAGSYSYLTVTVTGQEGHPAAVVNDGNALVRAAHDLVALTRIEEVDAVDLSVPDQKLNRTPDEATFTLRYPPHRELEVKRRLGELTRSNHPKDIKSVSWEAAPPPAKLLNSAVVLQVAKDIVHASRLSEKGKYQVTPTMVKPQADGSITWVPDCRVVDTVSQKHVLNSMNELDSAVDVKRDLPAVRNMDARNFEEGCLVPPFEKKSSRRLFDLVRTIRPDAKEMPGRGGSDANQFAALGMEVLDGAGPDGDGDHGPLEAVIGGLKKCVDFTTDIVRPALQLAQKIAFEKPSPTLDVRPL